MDYIQIPIPDFSFDTVAKEKAAEISFQLLHQHAVWQYGMGGNRGLEERLTLAVNKIIITEERVVCIKELINHVYSVKVDFSTTSVVAADIDKFYTGVNHIQYHLYALAKIATGYTFDSNGFCDSEINDLRIKIDLIIDALNKVQLGQDIIFDEFDTIREQIKNDIQSWNSDLVLGKRKFSKIALGTIGSYLGNKTADAIFDQIKPTLIAFFMAEAPHLVEHIEKLLNQNNM